MTLVRHLLSVGFVAVQISPRPERQNSQVVCFAASVAQITCILSHPTKPMQSQWSDTILKFQRLNLNVDVKFM